MLRGPPVSRYVVAEWIAKLLSAIRRRARTVPRSAATGLRSDEQLQAMIGFTTFP